MTGFGYNVSGFGAFPSRGASIDATGGTKTTSGDYTIHTFTSSGTFTVNSGSGDVGIWLLQEAVAAGLLLMDGEQVGLAVIAVLFLVKTQVVAVAQKAP